MGLLTVNIERNVILWRCWYFPFLYLITANSSTIMILLFNKTSSGTICELFDTVSALCEHMWSWLCCLILIWFCNLMWSNLSQRDFWQLNLNVPWLWDWSIVNERVFLDEKRLMLWFIIFAVIIVQNGPSLLLSLFLCSFGDISPKL